MRSRWLVVLVLVAVAVTPAGVVSPSGAAGAAARAWQRPVDGPLLRPFSVGPDRFAAGQHRGVDLAAAPATRVRAACGGRGGFAGRAPRGGPAPRAGPRPGGRGGGERGRGQPPLAARGGAVARRTEPRGDQPLACGID